MVSGVHLQYSFCSTVLKNYTFYVDNRWIVTPYNRSIMRSVFEFVLDSIFKINDLKINQTHKSAIFSVNLYCVTIHSERGYDKGPIDPVIKRSKNIYVLVSITIPMKLQKNTMSACSWYFLQYLLVFGWPFHWADKW